MLIGKFNSRDNYWAEYILGDIVILIPILSFSKTYACIEGSSSLAYGEALYCVGFVSYLIGLSITSTLL